MSLNFRNQIVKNGDVNISVNVMGSGEPLLLIHGYPETHLTWHKIVPENVYQNLHREIASKLQLGWSSKTAKI